MQCEICHSQRVSLWAKVSNFEYYRCETCQYLYVYPRPSPSDLEKYYEDSRFYKKAESERSRLMVEAGSRVRMLSALAKEYGLKKCLMDVGCASGLFLEQAQKGGWETEGIELSPVLAAKARAKGLSVKQGWIEGLSINTPYPVVTAWEVIEHTVNPVKFLNNLRACVQAGGLVALSTPLSNGLPATILKSKFPMICPPEHISLFSKRAIMILGRRFGFETVRVRSFSNLQRKSLERGLARFVFGPMSLPEFVARGISVMLSVPVLPLVKLIDSMGFGSEIEVVFRRIV